jgi:NitT/TauT family transport system substrate-binding protein
MRRWTKMLLMLLLPFLIGCRQEPAAAPERITLGMPRGPYALLVWLAQEEGFFADHGLEVKTRVYDSGFLALNDLDLQLDMVITPEYPLVLQTSPNPSLRILATVATSDIHELVARRDLGINSVDDLRGRSIGVTADTAAEFFLYNFLGLEPGISWRDVSIRHLSPDALLEAVAQGAIEAAVLGGNEMLHLQEQLGERAISWPSPWGLKSYWCLVTGEQQPTGRPATVQAMLAALIAAEEAVARRPALVEKLAGRGYLRTGDLPIIQQRMRFRVALEQGLLLAMEEEAEWLGVRPPPNYLQWMDLEPLLSLSPQRVTLFR